MADIQPFPAWNADGLLDNSDRQSEPPMSALGGLFALMIVGGIKLARAMQEGERHAAKMLAE